MFEEIRNKMYVLEIRNRNLFLVNSNFFLLLKLLYYFIEF